MSKPQWIAVMVVAALVLLPVAVWLDLRNLSDASLNAQATSLNTMITGIRSYYARNVVGRVLAANGTTQAAHNYEAIPGAIPIPATLSIEMAEVIGGQEEDIGYRFVSDQQFANRAAHQLDAFESSALAAFRESRDPKAVKTEITGSIFDRKIRIAAPVIMGAACVACHNTHPESPNRDWKVGDVRGIQAISIAQPIAENIWSLKYLLTYFAGAGLFGFAFTGLQIRQALHFRRMNMELEEANSFLASVSMKISKYLSPQVYKSIFSGERDVVISTERKKLTIFFSDLKDFTVSSERLQPEELTTLLNEYFTEMSKIATEHGATVDKFIGDAILAFFGDPETMGAEEDALACLNMAIAMQRRMVALNADWRRRGIEKPLQARMGINTGYCNVGNFGSEDRMDYTIIGAEANLAARLESIAEPGGIVMSYETYALVEDHVRASAMEPIRLKGISRDVVPYRVEDIHTEGLTNESGFFNESADGVRLFLDINRLDSEQAEQTAEMLASMLEALKQKKGDG
ncbi:adenylate/guanylate cyclase domain-containing protein [Breoghania sp. L-A4]|uniref:adenylate/guanylate cyclase domain-containing protein n=1 Tax=Breoghania sp. L-A4 TaxID=2304600 RepID=UPI0020BDB490|nr:adenylate/guanylate cyclase domain-containing protein [Breoghania sp. L-A4]